MAWIKDAVMPLKSVEWMTDTEELVIVLENPLPVSSVPLAAGQMIVAERCGFGYSNGTKIARVLTALKFTLHMPGGHAPTGWPGEIKPSEVGRGCHYGSRSSWINVLRVREKSAVSRFDLLPMFNYKIESMDAFPASDQLCLRLAKPDTSNKTLLAPMWYTPREAHPHSLATGQLVTLVRNPDYMATASAELPILAIADAHIHLPLHALNQSMPDWVVAGLKPDILRRLVQHYAAPSAADVETIETASRRPRSRMHALEL